MLFLPFVWLIDFCHFGSIHEIYFLDLSINSTAKFYISISYQKDLLSIDIRIFTPSPKPKECKFFTLSLFILNQKENPVQVLFFLLFMSYQTACATESLHTIGIAISN